LHRHRNGNESRSETTLREVPADDADPVLTGYWRHHMFFGHFDQAIAAIERARASSITVNEYSPIALNIAEAHRLAGRPEEATPNYRTALDELDRELAERAVEI
jgi:tetratricopeptide (TPR) repeat protein